MDDLREKGAEGIILGCTEIPLIIKEKDTDVPLLDTTRIHAKAIVDFALGAE
jgi:aspartate racemase